MDVVGVVGVGGGQMRVQVARSLERQRREELEGRLSRALVPPAGPRKDADTRSN